MHDEASSGRKISVIIVDDSMKHRTILRVLLSSHPMLEIIGEAVNGIEALELIWEIKPDVILMECEMPLMDGMTALQHLMIHVPTPTVLFSRITPEGSARSFDALKNGAVDFIGNDKISEIGVSTDLTREFCERVIRAAGISVRSTEPIFPVITRKKKQLIKTLVFCEECGAKTELVIRENEDQGEVLCSKCREYIPVVERHRYRRANFLSVIIGGDGAYANLLKIVPALPQDINGAIIVVLRKSKSHVDDFAEYLNSMSTVNILRVSEGMQVQGGNMYLASEGEVAVFRPFSAQYTFHLGENGAAQDSLLFLRSLRSFSQTFKERFALSVISGADMGDAETLKNLLETGGRILALNPNRCLGFDMNSSLKKADINCWCLDEEDLADQIAAMHSRYRDSVVMA